MHHLPPFPHQRLAHVHAGGDRRMQSALPGQVLGVRILARNVGGQRHGHLSVGRDGALPARPTAERAERSHKVRIGLGPGVPEAAGAAFLERTGVLMLEGYGATESNFVIAASPDSPRRGSWAGCAQDSMLAWSMRTTTRYPMVRPVNSCFARTNRSLSPRAISASQTRPLKRGAICGSTLATAWSASRTAAFRFIDRIKDAIRRRGENISSWEVEQVLLSHPAVAACAVYPVPL